MLLFRLIDAFCTDANKVALPLRTHTHTLKSWCCCCLTAGVWGCLFFYTCSPTISSLLTLLWWSVHTQKYHHPNFNQVMHCSDLQTVNKCQGINLEGNMDLNEWVGHPVFILVYWHWSDQSSSTLHLAMTSGKISVRASMNGLSQSKSNISVWKICNLSNWCLCLRTTNLYPDLLDQATWSQLPAGISILGEPGAGLEE